jgi:hypothetical protein
MRERSFPLVARRFLVSLCSLLLLIQFSGCATYQVQAARDHRPASRISEDEPINVFFWGLVRDNNVYGTGRKGPDGTRIGFDLVRVEVFVLPTILTFGIWMPGRASYIYAESPAPSGTITPPEQ